MIIFLDFDGVTHKFPCGEEGLFCRVELIWQILRAHPEIVIIFSTSWREAYKFELLVDFVTHGGGEDLAHRFIGSLPVIEIRSAEDLSDIRFREIQQYLVEHGCEAEAWIALDDDAALFPAGCSNLVLCDSDHGFTVKEAEAVRKAIAP